MKQHHGPLTDEMLAREWFVRKCFVGDMEDDFVFLNVVVDDGETEFRSVVDLGNDRFADLLSRGGVDSPEKLAGQRVRLSRATVFEFLTGAKP